MQREQRDGRSEKPDDVMNSMEELTKDDVFEILSSSRRRQILAYLYRHGGEADLRSLARNTATKETDGPVDDDVAKRFYISLYQTHVPKLEEVGLVRYDRDTKVVELTDRIDEVGHILNEDSTPDRPWPLYYGTLALLGVAIAIGQLVWLSFPAASLAFSVTVLALALYQYYETEFKEEEYSFLNQPASSEDHGGD